MLPSCSEFHPVLMPNHKSLARTAKTVLARGSLELAPAGDHECIKLEGLCCSFSRQLHLTPSQLAIEEFFDDPKNYGESKVKSGRAWRPDELRLKSNSDLHKLWFVLYKERNMLYTMQEAARAESEVFPSPERIDKVEESMANLENVVRERNKAYWQLEVSPTVTGERPSVYRRDIFGRHGWRHCSQRLVPYLKNFHFRNSQGPGDHKETQWFSTHYREMMRKNYNARRSKTARHIRDLFRRFPDADADHIANLHPEFPDGYVKHLKENVALYDDPPAKATMTSVRLAMGKMDDRHEENLIDKCRTSSKSTD